MKAILLSVNKPYAGHLVGGAKWLEWRTKPLPKVKAYIYETKKGGGCGKVIGEVKIFVVQVIPVNALDRAELDQVIIGGMVGVNFLQNYAAAHKTERLYANFVGHAKRYDKPKELSEFSHFVKYEATACAMLVKADLHNEKCLVPARLTRPLKSWCYVEEL